MQILLGQSYLHVKDITVYNTECIVAFEEDVSFAPRVYGRWQVRMPNVSDPQYKAMLAMLMTAYNSGTKVRIVGNQDKSGTIPSNVYDLPVLVACSNLSS